MNSPLQGGKKRGIGWDGPTLTRSPPKRRRGVLRWLGAVAAVTAGVATWLAVGTAETADPPRLGAAGAPPAPPTETRDVPAREPAPERGPGRQARAEAAGAAVSLEVGEELNVDLDKQPAAGLVFDVESGRTLWRRNPTDELPIASLTKIMSALLVSEEVGSLKRRVRIGSDGAGLQAAGGLSGSAVGLEPGMRVKAGPLFHAMMIASANDASTALAIHVAGSSDRFVERMNRRARGLDLDCTRFVSPHGLEPENRSCARDLATLTRLAMERALIARVVRKERAVVDFPIDGGERHLASTNPLTQVGYEGTIGLKTGYTQEAGSCLVAVARRDGRTLAAVLIDSPDVGDQARRLLDAGFAETGAGSSGRGGDDSPSERSRRQ